MVYMQIVYTVLPQKQAITKDGSAVPLWISFNLFVVDAATRVH